MAKCKGCAKLKRNGDCAVFKEKPKNCWAYTKDPKWLTKVMKDVRNYRKYKKGDIAQYWG